MTATLPTAVPSDSQLFRFARRMDGLQASAIRELLKLTERPEVISFAGGLPAPELFPVSGFAEACAEVLHADGPAALQYSTTEGYAPLRAWVCEHLQRHNGIETDPDRVLIVSGSQQGLDLAAKVLLDPGDLVVVENPAYMGAIQAFQAYEAAFLEVATDGFGMVPEALREALARAERKPKLIYLVANFANPTGVTTSLERRRELVAIAREHAIPIFEDDPYGRLRYSGDEIPALAALAGGRGVLYAGTASKTMVPGMRVAWLVIPETPMYEKVVMVKQAADLHTSTFAQRAVHAFAARPGALEAHVAKLIPVYRERRDAMLEALAERMPAGWSWTRPAGGLFLWVRAPEGVDTTVLLGRALERNVAFVPGAPFWVNRDVRNTLRLNFSNAGEARIREGVARLAQAAAALD
ncbi:MAG: PLP-dependent aminotransferase family protein [Candidatus Baltobacteraceae bacterium]